jgi:hypothetical protein
VSTARARIANVKALAWCNLATEWEGRAADLEKMYRDHAGAADARAIAEMIRAAAERLQERTR